MQPFAVEWRTNTGASSPINGNDYKSTANTEKEKRNIHYYRIFLHFTNRAYNYEKSQLGVFRKLRPTTSSRRDQDTTQGSRTGPVSPSHGRESQFPPSSTDLHHQPKSRQPKRNLSNLERGEPLAQATEQRRQEAIGAGVRFSRASRKERA